MSFFTGEKYKYWVCTVEEQSCKVGLIEMKEEVEKELERLEDVVRKTDEDLEELIKQRSEINKKEKKDSKDTAKLSEIQNKILTAENKRRTDYSKGKKLEEQYNYYKGYSGITYEVSRLKDIYSREETIHIQILNNDVEDGIIVTDISRLDIDIAKLEKFGVPITPSYLDELVKIIKNNYFAITVTERAYIDNGVSEKVVQEFIGSCLQKMGSDLQTYLSKDKKYFDVPTTELNDLYKESPFRRYSLRDIKEAMVIYGYMATPNKGRMDSTINNQKVIRFIKDKVDSVDRRKGTGNNK